MACDEPGGDGSINLRKVTGEEVIGIVDDGKLIFSGESRNKLLDFCARAKFIICSVNK